MYQYHMILAHCLYAAKYSVVVVSRTALHS